MFTTLQNLVTTQIEALKHKKKQKMKAEKAILYLTITVISVFLFLIIAKAVKMRKLQNNKPKNQNLWPDAAQPTQPTQPWYNPITNKWIWPDGHATNTPFG